MTSVSMRRVGPPAASGPFGASSSRNPSLRGQPAHPSAPISIRAPVQVEDFAFADTIVANELTDDAEPPPSGPIFFNDGAGPSMQCVTPLAFRLPAAADHVDLSTRLRVLSAHARHAFRRSLEEMRELWGGTAEIVQGEVDEEGGPTTTTPFVVFLRRALVLWSCFQWSRADLTRAAMIGIGVFMVVGAIGATTMDFSDSGGATSSEVRVRRTLDQHTARKIVLRIKR